MSNTVTVQTQNGEINVTKRNFDLINDLVSQGFEIFHSEKFNRSKCENEYVVISETHNKKVDRVVYAVKKITIEKIASDVKFNNVDDVSGLENAVFETVSSQTEIVLSKFLSKSDNWSETGLCNCSRAKSLFPNFSDSSNLGEWFGYNLESVQKLMQNVFDVKLKQIQI